MVTDGQKYLYRSGKYGGRLCVVMVRKRTVFRLFCTVRNCSAPLNLCAARVHHIAPAQLQKMFPHQSVVLCSGPEVCHHKTGFPGDLMNHMVRSFKPEVLTHNRGYPRNIIHYDIYLKNNQRFVR